MRASALSGRAVSPGIDLTDHFLQGFVAAGLASAAAGGVTDRAATRRILKHALVGGVAKASAVATAEAIGRKRYLEAATAVAVGAMGTWGAVRLLDIKVGAHPGKEN